MARAAWPAAGHLPGHLQPTWPPAAPAQPACPPAQLLVSGCSRRQTAAQSASRSPACPLLLGTSPALPPPLPLQRRLTSRTLGHGAAPPPAALPAAYCRQHCRHERQRARAPGPPLLLQQRVGHGHMRYGCAALPGGPAAAAGAPAAAPAAAGHAGHCLAAVLPGQQVQRQQKHHWPASDTRGSCLRQRQWLPVPLLQALLHRLSEPGASNDCPLKVLPACSCVPRLVLCEAGRGRLAKGKEIVIPALVEPIKRNSTRWNARKQRGQEEPGEHGMACWASEFPVCAPPPANFHRMLPSGSIQHFLRCGETATGWPLELFPPAYLGEHPLHSVLHAIQDLAAKNRTAGARRNTRERAQRQ